MSDRPPGPSGGASGGASGGELGELVRAFDWTATSLGPRAAWPQSLRTAVDLVLQSPVPMVLLWGSDGVMIYNDAYSGFAGARHPRLLGSKVLQGWPEVADFNAHVMRVGLAGGTLSYRDQQLVLYRHGVAENVWMDLDYSPVLDERGAPSGVLAVVVETTERVRAQRAVAVERARLEEVFRRSPGFAVTYRGPEHRYEFVNEAYYGLVGRRDVLGLTLDEAIPEAREQGFTALLDRVLDTGEPWVGHESPVWLERTPGAPRELRYVDMVFQALVEADGTRSGVLAHGVDVTEHVLARREVERLLAESERARAEAETARRDAEAANAAKSQFLANMSHELRTPLNAIGGYAQLLELGLHGPVTEPQRDALVRVQGAQRHLLALINDILNYAKLESGTVEYDLRAVDVREVVADVVPLVEPQMSAKGLALDVRLPATPCMVRADAEKLGQVLVNLLSNATKFTDARQPASELPGRITVDVTTTTAEGAALVLVRVTDTGVGIAPEKHDVIFEPFIQIRTGYAQSTDGTGLGLAISRDLARGMGGDIRVESLQGAGATFTIVLRRALDAAPPRP